MRTYNILDYGATPNGKLCTKNNYQNITFIQGNNIEKVHLQNVDLSGFTNPKIEGMNDNCLFNSKIGCQFNVK
jgi:hypothetical protein